MSTQLDPYRNGPGSRPVTAPQSVGAREIAKRAEAAITNLHALLYKIGETASFPDDYLLRLMNIDQSLRDYATAKAYFLSEEPGFELPSIPDPHQNHVPQPAKEALPETQGQAQEQEFNPSEDASNFPPITAIALTGLDIVRRSREMCELLADELHENGLPFPASFAEALDNFNEPVQVLFHLAKTHVPELGD